MHLISEEVIYRQFGSDDPEAIREIIQLIQTTHVKELKELGNLYSLGDWGTIKKKCHKAKPSMDYLGAFTITRTLEQIEFHPENSESVNLQLQNQLIILESELTDFLLKLS